MIYLASTYVPVFGAATGRENLTNIVRQIIPNAAPGSEKINYVGVAQEVQYWIFALVGVIAVIYLIWAGAKLIWAPGNTEEIGTAMKSIGYIVVGLALIPFAWFIVSFIIHFSI